MCILRILALAIVANCTTVGSEAFAQNIAFGLEIGPSWVTGATGADSSNDEFSGRLSGHAMVFAQLPLSAMFAIQSGVRISQQGDVYRYQMFEGTPNARESRDLMAHNYVSVPLRLSYDLRALPLYVRFGPEVGYLVSANWYHDTEGLQETEKRRSVTEGMRRWNVAIGAGVGTTVTVGTKKMFGQMMYSGGLMNAAKDLPSIRTLRTSELSLSVGIVF